MERRCERCVEALEMFVSAYGAEAGNIALRAVATAGVYVGGGIAPKILPALESGAFLEAFRAKEPMADLVATIPVAVILNPDAGLLGAASYAQDLSLRAYPNGRPFDDVAARCAIPFSAISFSMSAASTGASADRFS